MSNMDQVLRKALAAEDLPFAVAMAANRGGVTYSGAAGETAGRNAGEDTVFRIFSMTKAVGSLAAMILIERGKISMDTPVADVLPAWNDLKVLDGWNGEAPILRSPNTVATVRHLATHTSGLEYEFWNADVSKYLELTGKPSMLTGTLASLMSYPLTTDPGTRWGYGTGIDWLGRMVEEIDGRRIDAFCREEIFEPLGMSSTSFEPDSLTDRLCDVSIRGEDGHFAPFELAPPRQPEFYGMGHALYSTAPDYLRFLRMVLGRGELEGARILSEDAMGVMCSDQMNGLAFRKMVTVVPALTADFDPFPGARVGHAFAFMRNGVDIPGRRSAGSLSWAGVCNTHYWIDPLRDVCAVIMTQSLPFVERRLMKIYAAYEEAVYAAL